MPASPSSRPISRAICVGWVLQGEPEVLGDDKALLTSASSQALLRRLATLEQQGAEAPVGEPALVLEDVLQPARDGRVRIHLLDGSEVVRQAPKIDATCLLWLLIVAIG